MDTMPKLQVLVVDDSPVYRKLIEHTLEDGGYAPLFAKTGNEGLELYGQHAPAIVITDWMMPDFSGPELCERIRGQARRAYTYIIVLTSISEKDNVVKGLAAGADDYLTKPFDPGELLARIGVGRRTIGLHHEIEAKNKLLEEMAHTDPLTRMPNRRAIEEWAARQLRGAARHGFALWVVEADLDSFKNINDSYGHGAGDRVLQSVATCFVSGLRAEDFVARIGGEEFVMLMTGLPFAKAQRIADELRGGVESLRFHFRGTPVRVTASCGFTDLRPGDTPDSAFERADAALYRAKHGGKNACVAAGA